MEEKDFMNESSSSMIIVGMIYALNKPLKSSLQSFDNAVSLSELFLFEIWSLGHRNNLVSGK